ncbi:hypothetical protein C7377_1540 [Balneicella halophila]|uniref:Uncharacterized protein n=1 Tax=Balneicella halophila TaxID=1537566 RepID=A0A7L4UMY4_BALHA|nr:hypothetical protein [Balneicella halophila]PVX49902.1 hypothetical protein C7377_1540 [Balneicella halophila]
MKKKLYRNAIILFVVVWFILASVLVYIVGIPFSFALAFKIMIGCAMIAMSYYYVVSRNHDLD